MSQIVAVDAAWVSPWVFITKTNEAQERGDRKSIFCWNTVDGRKFYAKGRGNFERSGMHPKFHLRFYLHAIVVQTGEADHDTTFEGDPTFQELRLPQRKKWTVSSFRMRGSTSKGRCVQIDFDWSPEDPPNDLKGLEIIIPKAVAREDSMDELVDYAKLVELAAKLGGAVVDANIAFINFAEAVRDIEDIDAPTMI